MGDDSAVSSCGKNGCPPVLLMDNDNKTMTAAIAEFTRASKSLQTCVNNLNTNVEVQNQKLAEGNRRFHSLEKRVTVVEHDLDGVDGAPGIKSKVAVLNERKPPPVNKTHTLLWGSGAGGVIVATIEIIKAYIKTGTGP